MPTSQYWSIHDEWEISIFVIHDIMFNNESHLKLMKCFQSPFTNYDFMVLDFVQGPDSYPDIFISLEPIFMEIKIYCNEIYLDCILVDLMLSTYNVQKGMKLDLNINDWILKIQLMFKIAI